MGDQELRRQAEDTLDHYHGLSGSSIELTGGRLLVDPSRPRVWDANHGRRVRAGSEPEIDDLLAAMDDAYRGMGHRQIVCDLDTPDRLEARLALEGWALDPALQHLLTGPLRLDRVGSARPEGLAIRAVRTSDDWTSMEELTRLDHLEEQAELGREERELALTLDMVAHRRDKAPTVQAWLASLDGTDIGMFSSMPPPPGQPARIGLVEDLFVRPEWRRRGVAVALIAHCVDDARARGADRVLIGSEPTDWPKHLYTRLGFEPWWVERWWRTQVG